VEKTTCGTKNQMVINTNMDVNEFMLHGKFTMALGSTQPLTEMSTTNVSLGKRRLVRRADNLTTFMC